MSVDGVECEEFYRNYLHDFIRLAHKCSHKDREYEIQEYEVRDSLCCRNCRLVLVHKIPPSWLKVHACVWSHQFFIGTMRRATLDSMPWLYDLCLTIRFHLADL